MSKYIDAEKLKSLLDAKYKDFREKAKIEGYTTLQYQYMADGIDIAEQLIDSLQQEQTEIDLGKEFDNFLEKENAYVDDDDMISYYNGSSFNHTYDIYPIARHFFELGLNAKEK